MSLLVSFNLASNRPANFSALCGNLESTAADPACLEILVKIDDEDEAMHRCVAAEQARRPFAIKALSTPGEGYFMLWKGLNELHKLCDPEAYFVCNLNDEIRFETRHWDKALGKYIGLFPDHLFRICTSVFKLNKYVDFWECGYAPENYAFTTKRWIDLQGDWNACHGPDSFQQFVAYYLVRSLYPDGRQHNRDVPAFDIEISGEGAFIGMAGEQLRERVRKGWQAWFTLVSQGMQTECHRRARRLQAYIEATEEGYTDFTIADLPGSKHVAVIANDGGKLLRDRHGFPLRYSYRVSWFKTTFKSWLRRPLKSHYCGGKRHNKPGVIIRVIAFTFGLYILRGPCLALMSWLSDVNERLVTALRDPYGAWLDRSTQFIRRYLLALSAIISGASRPPSFGRLISIMRRALYLVLLRPLYIVFPSLRSYLRSRRPRFYAVFYAVGKALAAILVYPFRLMIERLGVPKFLLRRFGRRRHGVAGAEYSVPRNLPSGPERGAAGIWRIAETTEDTFIWKTYDEPLRASEVKFVMFTPAQRGQVRDVSVVAANMVNGKLGEWEVIPGRISRGSYSEKIPIPSKSDRTVVKIQLDGEALGERRFNTYGLACYGVSRPDLRNYQYGGKGIYVRELTVIE